MESFAYFALGKAQLKFRILSSPVVEKNRRVLINESQPYIYVKSCYAILLEINIFDRAITFGFNHVLF